jgi:hypothetical protein
LDRIDIDLKERAMLARIVATVALAGSLLLTGWSPSPARPCFAPTEDSSTAHCHLDPDRHYDYRGAWWPTGDPTRPTGAELAAAQAADAAPATKPCWLKPRDGWKPVPRAILAQLVEDGETVTRHARIRYGDTSVVDLDGRCGGRKVSS